MCLRSAIDLTLMLGRTVISPRTRSRQVSRLARSCSQGASGCPRRCGMRRRRRWRSGTAACSRRYPPCRNGPMLVKVRRAPPPRQRPGGSSTNSPRPRLLSERQSVWLFAGGRRPLPQLWPRPLARAAPALVRAPRSLASRGGDAQALQRSWCPATPPSGAHRQRPAACQAPLEPGAPPRIASPLPPPYRRRRRDPPAARRPAPQGALRPSRRCSPRKGSSRGAGWRRRLLQRRTPEPSSQTVDRASCATESCISGSVVESRAAI